MTIYFLVVLCGMFAGFIGTLAGLGAVLSLYLLIDVVGLDATIANGTNRLGVLAMALMALPTFKKNGHLNLNKSKHIIGCIVIGAIGGFTLAVYADEAIIKQFFKYLLPFLLVVILSNPKKWMRETDSNFQMNPLLSVPIFLAIGFYAGFIQAGTGVLLVVVLTLMARYSLIDANGVKLSAFAMYTGLGILVFALNGKIDWEYGGFLALGQGVGGYCAAQFATSYPSANRMVRYLLIVVLIAAIFRMFECYQYFV